MFILPEDQRNQELLEDYKKAGNNMIMALVAFGLTVMPFAWLLSQARLSWLLYGITQSARHWEAFIFCVWMLFNVGTLVIVSTALCCKNLYWTYKFGQQLPDPPPKLKRKKS